MLILFGKHRDLRSPAGPLKSGLIAGTHAAIIPIVTSSLMITPEIRTFITLKITQDTYVAQTVSGRILSNIR